MSKEGRVIKPNDIIRREKIIPFRAQHTETEIRAKVSSYIAKQDVTVDEMIDILERIAQSWKPVGLALEKIKDQS